MLLRWCLTSQRAASFGKCDWSLMFFGNVWQYSLIGRVLPQALVLILAISRVPGCFHWGNSILAVANIDYFDDVSSLTWFRSRLMDWNL